MITHESLLQPKCLQTIYLSSYEHINKSNSRRQESAPGLIRGTETAYKAQSPGKSAPFDSAQGALSLPKGHHITKPWILEIG